MEHTRQIMAAAYDHHRERKIRCGMLAIAAVVVAVCLTISVIGANNRVDETVTFANAEEPTEERNDAGSLSDQELLQTRQLVQKFYGDSEVEVAIRWNTVRHEEVTGGEAGDGAATVSFLIDLDDYRQTYRVYLADEIYLSCPELDESKYPDSFCASSVHDSFDVVFGAGLPYSDETEAGDLFAVSRSADRTSGVTTAEQDNTLQIDVYSCPLDEAARERIGAAVDNYILSRGATPDIFRKDFTSNCSHGE